MATKDTVTIAGRHLYAVHYNKAGVQSPGDYRMSESDVRNFCDADETGLSLLRSAMARFGLSAGMWHKEQAQEE